jgi:hypothetical protein
MIIISKSPLSPPFTKGGIFLCIFPPPLYPLPPGEGKGVVDNLQPFFNTREDFGYYQRITSKKVPLL